MMLHWILSLLILLVFQMFLSEWLSFILAVLFMVHPVHTEAVTGVVGRAEVLSAIFVLLALKCYEKGSGYRKITEWKYIHLTILMVVIATLCKEQGIAAVPICCAYEVLWLQRVTLWEGLHLAKMIFSKPRQLPSWFITSLIRMLFLLFTTVGLMALRILVMGAELPHFTAFDNPPASAPTPVRQLTQWYLLPLNAWILLYPFPLLCDYSMGTIPLIKSFADPRNLATMNFITVLSLLTGFALTGNTRTSRQACMALAFMAFPFLPASNLLFPVGFVIAERILYVPSLGFSMLVVIGLRRLLIHDRFKKLIYGALIITVALHAAKTARRNIDWKSEKSLFMAGLQITTMNAKIWNNVGHSYEREQRPEIALHFFKQASVDAHASEGSREDEAIDPKFLSIYVSMAAILRKNESRYPDALELYKKAIRMWNEYEDAYLNLGDLLVQMNQTDQAEQVFRKLLEFSPRSANGLYNMGVVEVRRKNNEGALSWFRQCLHFHPKHAMALYSLALIEDGKDGAYNPESLDRLLQVAEVEKHNYKIMTRIGLTYKKLGDLVNAEKYLNQAVQLNDTFGTALFNLGHIYRQQKEYERALQTLESFIKINRNHLNAWLLLGDIYVTHKGDYDAAWNAFEEAGRVEPGNVQVAHNFCVIMVKRQQYMKAKECLEELANQTDEEFVTVNLNKLNELIEKKQAEGDPLT
ncbi:hypothetical protein BSL78_18604 [Apostichopus japonicus]|uniref:dolichyl-phosphate-mannose--protein mannosyltransferase n=1 Tax=Stichopus japonicus TaxID=307972 RepID=A0A2G8K987_STIJA|nr:hypothetical protein BSL78_18604 [Apostichopus japonicus]